MLNTYKEKDYSLNQLENHIYRLRKELIDIGMEKGFNSSTTIQISQQLDYFIFQYQRFKS
ncbi:aspartyl-phosphate phosphatase Spo0E family protein [Niallia nealsonii]|uniref:aspartyl-phosphate phosphatase Spo0E family protein n=1 Tax=Niallia nealsonii TaxID=115979 RepID=UPI0012FEDB8B|nr:aspartyl-phosphate phosphatase Spo0E family protein [Niallia nealsonii]